MLLKVKALGSAMREHEFAHTGEATAFLFSYLTPPAPSSGSSTSIRPSSANTALLPYLQPCLGVSIGVLVTELLGVAPRTVRSYSCTSWCGSGRKSRRNVL